MINHLHAYHIVHYIISDHIQEEGLDQEVEVLIHEVVHALVLDRDLADTNEVERVHGRDHGVKIKANVREDILVARTVAVGRAKKNRTKTTLKYRILQPTGQI